MYDSIAELFRPLTPLEKARRERTEAMLQLLEAQTGLEWALSSVEYNQARIKRLDKYIEEEEQELQNLKIYKRAIRL